MAGLLNTEGYNFYSLKFVIAVVAELLGVLLFAFYGDTTPKEYAAWGNGLALAIVGVLRSRCHVLSLEGKLQDHTFTLDIIT